MIRDGVKDGHHNELISPQPVEMHDGPSGSEDRRLFAHWHILTVVLGATFIAYARTLSFEFVYDDFLQLVTNPAVHSWRYFPEYFTRNVWAEVYPNAPSNYYRPVFLLWCRLNDAVFGNQAGMWHLTSVLAHVITTALVYFLVLRLVRDRLTAGMAGLIFGLHPVHIEAVAWVSAVTEPLMGVFFISAFLCYLRWRAGGQRAQTWLVLALFLYAMGMLAKETTVILPGIIGVHEWLYGTAAEGVGGESLFLRARRTTRVALPFCLLTIPYLIARVAVLKGFSHVITSIPWAWVVFTWPSLLWFWAKHLVAPVGLGSSYDLRTVEHPGLVNFILPAAALVGIFAALGWWAKRSRDVAFACAWLILPLIPLLNFAIFPHDDFAHDRYLYLPSVGFALIVALAMRRIGGRRVSLSAYAPAQILLTLALAIAFGIGTWRQSFYFENNWIFYRYNYLLAPSNPYAANNYGAILARLGMREEAIKVLQRANDENPGYWSLAYNLGTNYYKAHQPELAERYLSDAIRIDPTRSDAYFCLGLTRLGAGNPKQAEAAFRAAIQLDAHRQEFHYDLGLALKEEGNLEGALAEFRDDLERNPPHREVRRQIEEIEAKLKATRSTSNPQGGSSHVGAKP